MLKLLDKDIKEPIMQQIRSGRVTMRPRSYFLIGSVLTFTGLVLTFLSTALLLSILYLSVREGGRVHQYKLETLHELFHWWLPIVALVAFGFGIHLLRRYEFSYRINFAWVTILSLVAVVVASALFVGSGAYETLLQRGPMHDLVKPWQGQRDGKGQQRGLQNGQRGNPPYYNQ